MRALAMCVVRFMTRTISLAVLALVVGCAHAGPDLARMRALHMTGNWSGNIQGIKPSPFASAQTISATTVQATVSRSSFVDSAGVTRTNDVAMIRLTGVTLGAGTSLAQAGFWVARDVGSATTQLQFKVSLDSSLAGISGFSGDVGFPISGGSVDTSQLSQISGLARDFAIAVLTQGATLTQAGAFTLQNGATLDKNAVVQALQTVQSSVQASQNAYFQWLKSENIEWIGISVAIFYDSIADPTVRVKYRPASSANSGIFTFDDADLQDFITRARREGFRIYMTLAFEPSNITPSLSDPLCKTPQHKPPRSQLGQPVIVTGDLFAICINPTDWWWTPTHPNHAANVAQFWNSYTQLAVKYGAIAQQLGVEMYSLGTETENLFRTRPGARTYTNDFRTQLTTMVASVRAVYSGLLTYDQFSNALVHPEFFDGGAGSTYLFADLGLDVVGISAYFPLTNVPPTTVLSVAQIETMWDQVFRNYLLPLQAANPGKRIVFTEFGYTDDVASPANANANAAAAEPAATNGSTSGMQQQQNIHQAFFNVNQRYNNLVGGTFIWGNDVFTYNPSMCTTIGWGLYCKPLGQTMASIYADWVRQDSNRVFAWAEAHYPQFFPSGSATQSVLGYTLRYYAATGTYLGIKDNRLVVHNGRNWNLLDVGALHTFLDLAGGEGF
jgi:hypothetical protein